MSAKDINIKIPTYYFFNDIINIKDFDPNNIKKDEKSYKNILLYNIGSVKIKKNLKKILVQMLSTLFQVKKMDTLKKLMEISV